MTGDTVSVGRYVVKLLADSRYSFDALIHNDDDIGSHFSPVRSRTHSHIFYAFGFVA